jgi:uncharacterized protein YciI
MDSNLFVVLLRYLVPEETIQRIRPTHLAFLDQYYAKNIFLASGRQVPAYGGVILARCENREDLLQIMHQDPFYKEGCAEFSIYEFTVTKSSEKFNIFEK